MGREFWRAQRASVAPKEVRRSVCIALKALDLEYEELRDVDGYVVDVVAHASIGSETPLPLAVLHHAPRRTLHGRTGEPLGQTMMRQRYLRNHGYAVVNLWDRAWDNLSPDEQVNFLSGRVHAICA